MELRDAFARSLKELREAQQLTQEDFDGVSSRTYISMLERKERSPTLDKLGQLATILDVHPLTILALTYMKVQGHQDPGVLMNRVVAELTKLRRNKPGSSRRSR